MGDQVNGRLGVSAGPPSLADGGGGDGGLRWRQTVQHTAMAAIHQSCTPCFRNRLRYSVGGMPISWVKTLE